VVETREHHHPFRNGEPPKVPKGMPKPHSTVGEHWEWDENKKKWKWTWYHDYGGTGEQIVREVKACPKCAN
jgi:hypothetical protein